MRKLLIASATLLTLAITAPPMGAAPTVNFRERGDALYDELGLEGVLDRGTFEAARRTAEQRGLQPRMLAIADMTQPSTSHRFFVIDL